MHWLSLWGPVVLVMGLIFVLSSVPDLPAPPVGFTDVQAHALIFAVLGLLVTRALCGARAAGVTPRVLVTAFVLTVVYGVSDELHQWFVPTRVAELRDLVADAVGAAVGVGAVWGWSIVLSARAERDRT